MSKDKIDLEVGDNVQLQFVDDERSQRARVQVKIIGQVPGKSVLISNPMLNGKLMLVREGQSVIGRMFSSGRVVGFTSSILKVQTSPFPYLHLHFPKALEQVVVRKSSRMEVSLTAKILRQGEEPADGSIRDISPSGCQLTCNQPLGEPGERIGLRTDFVLRNGEKHTVPFAGIIRNAIPENVDDPDCALMRYGIQFGTVERQSALVIRAFLYEQMDRQNTDSE